MNFFLTNRVLNNNFMKLFVLSLLSLILLYSPMQAQAEKTNEEKINAIKSKVDTLVKDVKLLMSIFDGKFTHLKFGGYIQPQYQHIESAKGYGVSPYNPDDIIKDRFYLRRARVKFRYESEFAGFVIETDYNNKGFKITDAYVRLTDPWTKIFTIKAGSFNRPVYEVEYSSSKRESPERSKITRLLYPGERDLGFSLVVKPKDLFQLDIAAFNNTYEEMYHQFIPNFGNYPFYYMISLKKDFLLGDKSALTLGVNTRLGNITANTNKVILPENGVDIIDSTSYQVGDGLSRSWYGVEGQYFLDWLTGVKIAASYMWGNNVDQPSEDGSVPLRMRKFSGWYVYFIKNIGYDWKAVVKYDTYNPNTAINANDIKETGDLSVGNLGFGIHNYTFSNFRLTLWYDMYSRQTTVAFPTDPNDSQITFRAQMKF